MKHSKLRPSPNVDVSCPWLAASPDGIVMDPMLSTDKQKGCLEVKCPTLCEVVDLSCLQKKLVVLSPKKKNWRNAVVNHTLLLLSNATEMHITRLQFIVWSPIEDAFVQRVYYNKSFMENIIATAQAFYFEKQLPSVIS